MAEAAASTWKHWTEPSFVDVDGLSSAYRRKGDGDVLLYLHGAGLTRAWLPLYDELSHGFDVVVPEHPGFGDTALPDWLTGIDDLVLHYDALLDALGLEHVHLVGHSLGGWIASYLAIFYPHRFDSLTLITPLGLRVPDAPMTDPFRLSPELALNTLLGEQSANYLEYFDRGDETEAMIHAYAESITFARLLWNPRYDVKLDRRLTRIQTPTLVLAAEDDRLIPSAHPKRWAELIPGSELRVVAGTRDEPTGHLVIIQQPEALAELIGSHVHASVAPSSGAETAAR
ncbi:MAG TPA: alpha/beta fold hydrolase [Solirubrobacteraceae bacterium]|nr:alpha/beta fold hydrolase [Solirubrobacteraceae bacterium]